MIVVWIPNDRRQTSWLFTKRKGGFEIGSTKKKIPLVTGYRSLINLWPPNYNTSALNHSAMLSPPPPEILVHWRWNFSIYFLKNGSVLLRTLSLTWNSSLLVIKSKGKFCQMFSNTFPPGCCDSLPTGLIISCSWTSQKILYLGHVKPKRNSLTFIEHVAGGRGGGGLSRDAAFRRTV